MYRIILMMSLMALAVCLQACASFTPGLERGSKPDTSMGYLYGRFTLQGEAGTGTCHLRVGLTVQQTDGSRGYTIEFQPTDDPVSIAVKPGVYHLFSFEYAHCDSSEVGERVLSPGLLTKPFTVEAGKAYYIADFVEVAQMTPKPMNYSISDQSISNATELTWQLVSLTDNYAKTTTLFHVSYPDFWMLPTSSALVTH